MAGPMVVQGPDLAARRRGSGRAFLKACSLADSGKLFLAGDSQGGHSALATQRLMERSHGAEFRITASAPMAGFYALTATFVDALDTPPDLGSVLFAFGLTGLQKNDGDVYSAPAAAFQAPFAASIESLLPGTLDLLPLLQQGLVPVKNMTLAAASFHQRGAQVTAVDLELIPAMRAAIDAQLAAAGTLLVYHGQIAPPLCFSVAKNQAFDPLR